MLNFIVKNALHHTGDAGGVGGDLQIPKAKGAHDAQHIIRLTDAHLEKKHSAGAQSLPPEAADGAVKVQAVLPAVEGTAGLVVLLGGV